MDGLKAGGKARPAKLALLLAAGAALAVASAVWAKSALFGTFSEHDDEGYLILALRAWRAGNALYDGIPTLYGPFYFQCVSTALRVLGLPLDNVGARWFALGAWTVTSLLCGAYVWRVLGSLLAAIAAWALSFAVLGALVREPLHPGSLIVLLLAVAAHVSLGFSARPVRPSTWVLLGVLTAAVALSKQNAGAFLLLAVLGTWLRFGKGGAASLPVRVLFALILVAFPFALMRGLLGHRTAQDYALLASVSFLPFGAMILRLPGTREPREPRGPLDGRWPLGPLLAFAAGGCGLALVSVAVALATGTTIGGMWEQLVLAPMRFATQTWRGPVLPPRPEILAALALVPVVLFQASRSGPAGRAAFAAIRLAAAAHALYRCLPFHQPMASLPFLWILAMPAVPAGGAERDAAAADRATEGRPTFFLALAIGLQSLHAYPVAGSQVRFFLFLIPLLGLVGIRSAWRDLPREWLARAPAWLPRGALAAAWAGGVLLIATSSPEWRSIPDRWRRYRGAGVELALPGAETVRVSEHRAAAYAWAAANLRQNADVFLGMPWRQSLHGWSGVPPPVPFYSAAWPILYDEGEQQRLAEALLAHARPCIVRTPAAIEAWRQGHGLFEGGIVRLARERFRVAGRVLGIEILVLEEASARVVMAATRVELPGGVAVGREGWTALRLAFPEAWETRIERIALVRLESGAIVCDSSGPGDGGRLEIADESGRPLPGSRGGALGLELGGRRDVLALCPPPPEAHRGGTLLVRVHDGSGRVVARLPVLD